MNAWDRAVPHLQAALDRSPGTHSLTTVAQAIASGRAQLWPGDHSAAVTETGRDLSIWLFGGARDEMPGMLASGEAFGLETGHGLMTIWDPRPGWARVLKPYGYRQRVALVKELHNGR